MVKLLIALVIVMGVSFMAGYDDALEARDQQRRLAVYCSSGSAIESLCNNKRKD
jgi:hypothetical protein